ncbi:hypothetical protein [Couchioplanes azureus]|uniref:hypothetical protein n=1 Tax=Couchioplanes caeruleus TaxID=56438 RepID=UPI00199AC2FB|nr:hypothetical protein [Couchioplanes caeruleus]GGQ40692.1 hypothetical protein GCM10010166_04820 [Couchioplanes caeruleus subsp. azureus]
MTLEAPASAPPSGPAPVPSPVGDRLITAAGMVVALLATVATALLELFTTPLRLGGVPICVAVLLAAAANYGIAWFAVTTVGRRWAVAPPWGLWTAIMFFAAGVRTPEGDYLIGAEDWVALAMILVGSLSFAVFTYRAILRGPTVTKL